MKPIDLVPFNIPSGGAATLNVPQNDPTFKASGIIFFSSDPANFASNGFFAQGFDDGTNRFGTAQSLGGFGEEHFWSDDASIIGGITSFAFELKLRAYVTSFNVGSFDLALPINTSLGNQQWVAYCYGSDIFKCKAGKIPSNSTFPFTITPGFIPHDLHGMWHSGAEGGTLFGTGADGSCSFGWGVSCDSQQVALGNALYKTIQKQGSWLLRINSSGTIVDELSITGWDASSITISGTKTGEYQSYFCVGGGTFSANVGIFTQGDNPLTFRTNEPVGMMVGSFCNVHSATAFNGLRASLGATDGTLQKAVGIYADANHTADCIRTSDDVLATLAHPNGDPSHVVDGQAIFTSFVNNLANLGWPTDDGTKRELFYIVYGTDPGEAPTFCGGVCCVTGKTRVEIHLNDKRQAAASFPNSEFSFSFLLEAKKNDVISIKAYQENGKIITMIPSVQIYRTAYEIHDKATGRNLEEPD